MLQHQRRGTAPAAGAGLVLVLAFTTACGPAADDETGAAQAKASSSAPAKPSATAAPNGVEKLKTAEILARAREATGSARSLRMRAEIDDGGQKFKLDFRYAGKTKATGWFAQGAQRVEITRIGKTVYLAGNDAFWTSAGGKGAAQMFSGKHVKSTLKNPDFKELAAFADRSSLLTEAVKSLGGWKKGQASRVGAVPTTVLTAATGDKLHVATQGRPYVLLLEGGPGNRLEYLGYEQPVSVQPPPAGSVVDADLLN
ncbi:hypothetical protein ACH35V_15325 [Actinomadura sp. 1N219]|uniref:hypothetical protein n=1 Tax=Actinomadura sp. 1N219 TaxID=3375152 RepID=UPI0037876203